MRFSRPCRPQVLDVVRFRVVDDGRHNTVNRADKHASLRVEVTRLPPSSMEVSKRRGVLNESLNLVEGETALRYPLSCMHAYLESATSSAYEDPDLSRSIGDKSSATHRCPTGAATWNKEQRRLRRTTCLGMAAEHLARRESERAGKPTSQLFRRNDEFRPAACEQVQAWASRTVRRAYDLRLSVRDSNEVLKHDPAVREHGQSSPHAVACAPTVLIARPVKKLAQSPVPIAVDRCATERGVESGGIRQYGGRCARVGVAALGGACEGHAERIKCGEASSAGVVLTRAQMIRGCLGVEVLAVEAEPVFGGGA